MCNVSWQNSNNFKELQHLYRVWSLQNNKSNININDIIWTQHAKNGILFSWFPKSQVHSTNMNTIRICLLPFELLVEGEGVYRSSVTEVNKSQLTSRCKKSITTLLILIKSQFNWLLIKTSCYTIFFLYKSFLQVHS